LKSVSIAIQGLEKLGSVNNMMIPAKGRAGYWVYSGNYRKAKTDVEKYLKEHYADLANYLADHPEFYYTKVQYIAWDHWLTKSSKYMKLKKKDVGNFIKNSEDVIFSFLGADDSSIVESHIRKGFLKPDESVALECGIQMYEVQRREDYE
jgi:Holliday junction resolvase RusA-like endonuclease